MNEKLIKFIKRVPVPLIVNLLGEEVTTACANYDIATTSGDLVKIFIDQKNRDLFKDQLLIKSMITHWNPIELKEFNELFQNKLSGEIPESICALEHVVFTLEDKYKKSNIFDNHLCPPYPECVEEFIGNQDISQCREK